MKNYLVFALVLSSISTVALAREAAKKPVIGQKIESKSMSVSGLTGRKRPGPKVGGNATVLVDASHGGGDHYTLCQNASSGVYYPCNLCGLSVADPSDQYECN